MIHRRRFIESAAGGLLALRNVPALGAAAPGKFRFAVIADTHIIDELYAGWEGSPESTDSILKATGRAKAARTMINALRPAMDCVFLVGDYFHNYPSTNLDFYFQHKTRIDNAKELTDGFAMPVHAGFGNHDYGVPAISRENTHELFRRKLNLKPYYSVEHKGFKFVHLNNFLGVTWRAGDGRYDKNKGSLGEEQLNWFEAELGQRKPTFVFIHYPLQLIATREQQDYDLLALLKRNKDTVQRVISGHWHKWFEFGRSFGPQHLVIAATRYDPNAYLVVEADQRRQSHELLSIDLVDWNTHYSRPWTGA